MPTDEGRRWEPLCTCAVDQRGICPVHGSITTPLPDAPPAIYLCKRDTEADQFNNYTWPPCVMGDDYDDARCGCKRIALSGAPRPLCPYMKCGLPAGHGGRHEAEPGGAR